MTGGSLKKNKMYGGGASAKKIKCVGGGVRDFFQSAPPPWGFRPQEKNPYDDSEWMKTRTFAFKSF